MTLRISLSWKMAPQVHLTTHPSQFMRLADQSGLTLSSRQDRTLRPSSQYVKSEDHASCTHVQQRPSLLVGAGQGSKPPVGRETDTHRLEQRQRQVSYGKNTLGYANYCKGRPQVRAHAPGCLMGAPATGPQALKNAARMQGGQEASG